MVAILRKYWFLIGLLVAMVAGYCGSGPLESASNSVALRRILVMTVMYLMALPLSFASIIKTLRQPWAALLASAVNYVLLPAVALLVSILIPEAFRAGFLVIAATPCTLASAAVWTRAAGGNDITALMTTVITNLASVFAAPLIVLWLMNESANVEFGEMVSRLLLLVLLPIVVAQICAARRPVGEWARARKKQLSIAAQVGILLMVILGTASSLGTVGGVQSSFSDLLVLVLGASLLHAVVLVAGFWLARMVGLERAEQIAVAIAGSQKTLMIGLLICLMLKVSLVPMVVYHSSQLIIDTLIVRYWDHQQKSQSPGTQGLGVSDEELGDQGGD